MNSYEICLSTPTHGKIGNHRNMCYEREIEREWRERERERECVYAREKEYFSLHEKIELKQEK